MNHYQGRAFLSEPDHELEEMRKLDEREFTSRYILPILRARYRGVEFKHGGYEHGRDALFWTIDELGDRKDKAVQVKVGNIETSSVQELIRQAKAAFTVPLIDESNNERWISELYVMTSGKITEPAKTEILHGLECPYSSVIHFWGGERVLQEFKEINKESQVLEYSKCETLMVKIGLFDLLNDTTFKDKINESILPVLVNDCGMSALQIVDGLAVMLEGLTQVKSKLQSLDLPTQRKPILLWFSWLIVTKAYYNFGAEKKFVFK